MEKMKVYILVFPGGKPKPDHELMMMVSYRISGLIGILINMDQGNLQPELRTGRRAAPA